MPTPRSLNEAFGPYARLELRKDITRTRRIVNFFVSLFVWLTVALMAGFAWGWLMHLTERVR